ncbi:MAG: hypothetical protein RSB18_05830, partial [Clostridia bacterium]
IALIRHGVVHNSPSCLPQFASLPHDHYIATASKMQLEIVAKFFGGVLLARVGRRAVAGQFGFCAESAHDWQADQGIQEVRLQALIDAREGIEIKYRLAQIIGNFWAYFGHKSF